MEVIFLNYCGETDTSCQTAMIRHITEKLVPPVPRFHLPRDDGLYQPILFDFVTDRMRQCIEHERQVLLDAVSPTVRARQEKVFQCYDPHASHRTYQNILRRFRLPEKQEGARWARD